MKMRSLEDIRSMIRALEAAMKDADKNDEQVRYKIVRAKREALLWVLGERNGL
jgi:hypothetical protein